MSNRFASGKHALGVCDICGLEFKLKELKPLIVKGRNTNLLVCPDDWNEDHPQNRLGEVRVEDPQALRNPRPETNDDTTPLPDWNAALAQITRNLP